MSCIFFTPERWQHRSLTENIAEQPQTRLAKQTHWGVRSFSVETGISKDMAGLSSMLSSSLYADLQLPAYSTNGH
ncbi:hypothetical protein [Paracandidimonas soli]|uniref:Uncharacterized protein n=1 Tax=Paracandidimonas soli TaxID=1917182 RepID=A0A4R3VH96_9BURK|nr:hypothetical protein [Paracandidimonas soli]TCV03134.1 hypothetical protein EV686_101597 [Paracandidimonas soli]